MNFFYSQDIDQDHIRLGPEEARHAIKSMRKKVHDEIHVLDGLGHRYDGVIVDLSKESLIMKISQMHVLEPTLNQGTHLAVALLKSPSRWEYLIEKCGELGIGAIYPIVSHRCSKKTLRIERSEHILRSALKQSGQPFMTILHDVLSFEAYVKLTRRSNSLAFIGYCAEVLPHLACQTIAQRPVDLLIGPEGDFTAEEYHFALSKGFQGVQLGHHRYRSETAAFMACHTIHNLYARNPL